MTLTKRLTKGSALTHTEMDANWDYVVQSSNQSYVPSGTGAVTRTVGAKLQERKSVLDWIPVALHAGIAAKTDTTDLTTYLQAAEDACEAAGCELFWPAGCYTFSSITIDAPVKWTGEGWYNTVNAAFGSSEWTTNSNKGGTILRSTAASGAALTFSTPSSSMSGYRFGGFVLIGPGSGTATGIKMAGASNALVQCEVSDVLVGNFLVGWELNAIYESSFYDVRSRGNTTGFKIQNAFNNNQILGIEVQGSTAKAIALNNASQNVFTNVLLQSISGTDGLEIEGEMNEFIGVWVEICTTTWAIEVLNGAGNTNRFSGVRMAGDTVGGFHIAYGGCSISNCRTFAVPHTIDATATGTVIQGMDPTYWTDNGVATVFLGFNTGATSGVSIGGGSGSALNAGGTLAVTGVSKFADGSISAPGIAFSSDTDTGLHRRSGNSISFVANTAIMFEMINSGSQFFVLPSTGVVTWGSGALPAGGDLILARDAAGALALKNSTNAQELRVYGSEITAATRYSRLTIKHATTTLAAVSGATVTASNLIPAKANVLGVNTIVTVALGGGGGTTGYTVGDGSDADRWGAVTGIVAGTDTDGNDATANPTGWFTAANSVVITAVGGNFNGTGSIYVDVAYTLTEAD